MTIPQGGVTFSGGEPLAQPEFLGGLLPPALRKEYTRQSIPVVLPATEQVLAVAARADLFLYDLKVLDDEKHMRLTGVSNALIFDNLRASSAYTTTSGCAFPSFPA